MYKKIESGNVYYNKLNSSYLVVIGYENLEDNYYERKFSANLKNMTSISPYIYKDTDRVIKRWMEEHVYYIVYETSNKNFLNDKIKTRSVRSISLPQLKNLLTQRTRSTFYKKLSKSELDSWVLKNKLLKHLNIDVATDLDLCCKSIKNVFLQGIIARDKYIKKYMDSRFMKITHVEDSTQSNLLVVMKGYKNNHVFLVTAKNTISPKVTLTGYALKTFKKSELLEMLNYLNMIGNVGSTLDATRKRLEKQNKSKEVRVLDKTKVMVWCPLVEQSLRN